MTRARPKPLTPEWLPCDQDAEISTVGTVFPCCRGISECRGLAQGSTKLLARRETLFLPLLKRRGNAERAPGGNAAGCFSQSPRLPHLASGRSEGSIPGAVVYRGRSRGAHYNCFTNRGRLSPSARFATVITHASFCYSPDTPQWGRRHVAQSI